MNHPIENKVNCAFVHVKNLKKTVKWYYNLLGLELNLDEVHSPVHNIPVQGHTSLTLDDHSMDPTFKFNPTSQVLFNFCTRDIDFAYAFIKEHDIEIVREIERVGDFAWFNFKDPDGNVLMICNG